MGLRFRKSINLGGGFRVNLSKSGVGYSWGTKGLRVTKTVKGKSRVTASIPGTGVSYVTESSSKRKKNAVRKQEAAPTPAKKYKIPLALKILAVVCGIGFAAYYYLGQGREISLAVGSGAIMGGLSYLVICFLYGAVAGSVESATHKDITSEENDPEER